MEMRDRRAVVALYVKTFAAIRHRAHEYRLPWTIVVARIALGRLSAVVVVDGTQIKDPRRETANLLAVLMGDVASHGQRFQINLGPHHCAAETEQNAPFQMRH